MMSVAKPFCAMMGALKCTDDGIMQLIIAYASNQCMKRDLYNALQKLMNEGSSS